MSLTIVPLAGPDFFTERFGIRPLHPVGGMPLIEYVLNQRPWLNEPESAASQLVFVLRQEAPHTARFQAFLRERFPGAETVVLGQLSRGAPFSVLAGLSLVRNTTRPVVVDLADIAFHTDLEPEAYFQQNPAVDAIVPFFESQDPKFSYLQINGCEVHRAREKEVISSHASAGVYMFRDVPTCLKAIQYCAENPQTCMVGSAYFMCPSVNGLIQPGRQVHGLEVRDVQPIGSIFH